MVLAQLLQIRHGLPIIELRPKTNLGITRAQIEGHFLGLSFSTNFRDCHIIFFYGNEDGGYFADIPHLRRCSAFGSTPEEAQRQVQIAGKACLSRHGRTENLSPSRADVPSFIRFPGGCCFLPDESPRSLTRALTKRQKTNEKGTQALS